MAKPSWITLSKTTGTSGTSTSSVTAAAFTGRVNRTGTITGTTTGGTVDTTSVTQTAKAEFITASLTETANVPATGSTYHITGTSNSAVLKMASETAISGVTYKLSVNSDTADATWDGITNTTVPNDVGASAEFTFSIAVTIPENKTTSTRTHTLKISNAGSVQSELITITQAAGVKTYSIPVISAFTYDDIAAAGGSVTPTISYSQTWGWNGNATNGGTLTSGGTIAYSGTNVNTTTGAVSATTLGTTIKARTKITTAGATVTMNGQSSTPVKNADVYQVANEATYGDISITSASATDIPASGGTRVTGTVVASQVVTFTSTATRTNSVGNGITATYTPTAGVTAASLGTTVKSRTKVGTLTATLTGEGSKTATRSIDVYQAANAITSYGDVTIGATTPISVGPSAGTYELDPKISQTITYTSGATRAAVVDAAGENTAALQYTVAVKTSATGFTTDTAGDYFQGQTFGVNYTVNPTVNSRNGVVLTITAKGESGTKTATKDIAFVQQGSDSMIELTPATITFTAAGGIQTLTIQSTDSWTLS